MRYFMIGFITGSMFWWGIAILFNPHPEHLDEYAT